MKTIQMMNSKLATFLVAFVLLFASCDNPIFDPGGDGNGGGGNGKPKDPPPTECSVKGTMVRIPCALGIYGDLWIKTDNGTYLQPCEQSFMTLVPLELNEGDRIEFGYTVQQKSSCDMEKITCTAVTPVHKSVNITCLRVIDGKQNEDCGSLLFDLSDYDPIGFQILETSMVGSLLKIKVGYSGCSQLENEDFLLSWKGASEKSEAGETYLHLFSPKLAEGMTCQAYFTNDLCFDIASVKSSTDSKTKVIELEGHRIVF